VVFIILVDIRFCKEDDFAQILNVDTTSPYAWSSNILYYELFKKKIQHV
jgi:hypothetical protein